MREFQTQLYELLQQCIEYTKTINLICRRITNIKLTNYRQEAESQIHLLLPREHSFEHSASTSDLSCKPGSSIRDHFDRALGLSHCAPLFCCPSAIATRSRPSTVLSKLTQRKDNPTLVTKSFQYISHLYHNKFCGEKRRTVGRNFWGIIP
jgi:hypothetical protein